MLTSWLLIDLIIVSRRHHLLILMFRQANDCDWIYYWKTFLSHFSFQLPQKFNFLYQRENNFLWHAATSMMIFEDENFKIKLISDDDFVPIISYDPTAVDWWIYDGRGKFCLNSIRESSQAWVKGKCTEIFWKWSNLSAWVRNGTQQKLSGIACAIFNLQ